MLHLAVPAAEAIVFMKINDRPGLHHGVIGQQMHNQLCNVDGSQQPAIPKNAH